MQKNTIRVNFKALPPKGMNIHGNEAQRLGGGGGVTVEGRRVGNGHGEGQCFRSTCNIFCQRKNSGRDKDERTQANKYSKTLASV